MKIEIIKCESQQWYSSLIGLQFDVMEHDDNRYAVAGDKNPKRLINKNDCEIVKPLENVDKTMSKRILS